jgi:hypothetical protein
MPTAQIAWLGVGAAALCVLLLAGANRMGVRHPLPYALLGIVLWLAVLYSGVHATIAGVVTDLDGLPIGARPGVKGARMVILTGGRVRRRHIAAHRIPAAVDRGIADVQGFLNGRKGLFGRVF